MPGDERVRAQAMRARPYRVLARYPLATGMVTLVLEPVQPGEAVPQALPGQYWVLQTPAGVRIPAIAGNGSAGLEVTTLRVPCAGPPLGEPGTLLGVRGPFGTGWDLEPAVGRTLLLVAWETGLVALRPVLEQVLSGTARYARVQVWAGGRNPRTLALHADADLWVARGMDVTIATGSRLTMACAAQDRPAPPPDATALLAGPLEMMLETAQALARRGLPPQRIQMAAHSLIRCTDAVCGRCRVGPADRPVLLACRNGPVFGYHELAAPLRRPSGP
ncbi:MULTISPECIES: oxidoreductase FAD/NAD(P)-binding domain-containing protein [Thermomonospora]|uniref:Oxidoreductase FAD/NAD(P)-binding domain protein n=1 Tax=Thermomonospora curvata (strain ATCC 19995 / DSM 43183 / JCM 3096 / KCTC 9072 / NBRC 15933 / NCIMB 10081 / Henssen B9) TaxID=471852 RepID=D1ADR5_THECD|nr:MULTISPECIES: oxidoreductase FAD/NAD(P)-binding domain-containing protein [Thermomonospora]ACY97525.1 oxidoreductase FAD/NAD(P)-binding domain protein [Thermomonospora curvata DSM 43183]